MGDMRGAPADEAPGAHLTKDAAAATGRGEEESADPDGSLAAEPPRALQDEPPDELSLRQRFAHNARHPYKWLNRDNVARELLLAGLVGLMLFVAAARLDAAREERERALAVEQFERAEVLENTRLVRQAVTDPGSIKVFAGLNLRGANLSGLLLGCVDGEDNPAMECTFGGADLRGADLSGAVLLQAYLWGTNLASADLYGANLFRAVLVGADLSGADLTLANLEETDLHGADLSDTDLSSARLGGACYSDTTIWPEGFEPPPANC